MTIKRVTQSSIELLAVVQSIKKFHQFLCGIEFTVITDHSSLKHIVNAKDPYGRLTRWLLFLQNYHITWEYRKGTENVLADHLSRPVGVVALTTLETTLQRVKRDQDDMLWDEKVDLAEDLKLELDNDGYLVKKLDRGFA